MITAGLMKPILRPLDAFEKIRARGYSPTGDFPAAIRASLTKVIRDPNTGAEHEVPKTSSNSPVTLI